MIKFLLVSGQARLSKGLLCTAGLEKWLGYDSIDLSPPQGLQIGQPPQIIFNNSRSSIKPESAPDPNNLL